MPSLAIARSQYIPGALKVASVASSAEVPPTTLSLLSGSNDTPPPAGARYRIHRIRRPICALAGGAAAGGRGMRGAEAAADWLRLRGLGMPSSVVEAVSF